jgi:hypothetical protein
MSNWYIDYHQALQLRLLGSFLVFAVLLPGVYLLVTAGSRLAKRVTWRVAPRTRISRGYET